MQFGRGPFTTAVYQKSNVNAFQLPAHVKPKEDMELKDIVMDHALPYLPAKSLMRFRSVSKEWDQWIMSPFLSHKQSYNFRDMSGYFYQHQDETKASFISLSNSAYGVPDFSLSFLRKKFVIRSSCNGLLLCQEAFGQKKYFLCNPSNKNWKVIPFPDFYHWEEPAIVLAFEPSVFNFGADYHLICALPMLDELTVQFEIYSSETRSWKCSTAVCMELEGSILKSKGFYMEGIAYWEHHPIRFWLLILRMKSIRFWFYLLKGHQVGSWLGFMESYAMFVCTMSLGIFTRSISMEIWTWSIQ